jgi:hypothetical protein
MVTQIVAASVRRAAFLIRCAASAVPSRVRITRTGAYSMGYWPTMRRGNNCAETRGITTDGRPERLNNS